MGGDDSAREYRVITDPSEGPKKFTLQTRVTSRGETAVILMGVDCAERVMCHDSVGLDLPEGMFVFNVGQNTSGILDQLLSQGALKIVRVEHARGMPVPVCELTPGGPAQPAFEGPHARQNADARRAAESAAADASGDAFFDALRAEDAKAQQHAQGAPPGMPARTTTRGAPPGMGVPQKTPPSAGADILAMLNGGSASPAASFNGQESVVRTPPVARQLMPRTMRGSTGGGARVRGGGASHDDGFFDASAGAPSPASVTSALAGGANTTGSIRRPGPPPGLSPLGGLAGGLGDLFGGGSAFGAPPPKPTSSPGTGDAGADILAALAGPARATPPSAKERGTPSNEDLLAMLAGGGDSSARASSPAPPPGTPAPLSIDELEAQTLASATKAAEKEKSTAKSPEEEEEQTGMLSADMGALGLGFLGITTDDDDFALPLRAAERKEPFPAAAIAAAEEEKETQPDAEGEKPKEDKEAARKEKREWKKLLKEEEKKRKEEEVKAAKAAAKASVTSYSSDTLLSMRAKCTSAPPEVDMEMFEHADKALARREEEKAEKREDAAPRPSPPPSRSRSDDRLDEPTNGGALGLGFLGISSGSLNSLDEGGGEKRGQLVEERKKAKAETKAETKSPMSVAELAKALLAELRGLEDRVEVAGDESGPMVLLKLGSALEAIRDEPFKSI